jgi:hypothetical protein
MRPFYKIDSKKIKKMNKLCSRQTVANRMENRLPDITVSANYSQYNFF